MNPFFGSVLVSTGDAARMTGHSPDYLLRLVRSGIVSGRKFGNTWFVSRYALEQHLAFLRPQVGFAFAEAQSEVLSEHMRSTQPPWLNSIAQTPLHEQLFALSIAAIVLFMGVGAANTNYLPSLGTEVAAAFQSVSQEVQFALWGSSSQTDLHVTHTVAQVRMYAAATQAMQQDIVRTTATPVRAPSAFSPEWHETASHNALRYQMQGIELLAALRGVVTAVATDFDSFHQARASIAIAYVSMGSALYGIAYGVPTEYLTLVHTAGNELYVRALRTRDIGVVLPAATEQVLASIGHGVQDFAQFAIRSDVRLAYGIAVFTPSVARDATIAIGAVGVHTYQIAIAAPYVARSAYLSIAAASAGAGPTLAQRGFAFEYAAAQTFLSAVQGTLTTYEGGVRQSAIAINASISSVFSATHQTLHDARVAINTFAQVSRLSVERGVTASASAVQALSSAISGRP